MHVPSELFISGPTAWFLCQVFRSTSHMASGSRKAIAMQSCKRGWMMAEKPVLMS